MEMFLIVCPLVFLAGFIDAIAGGGGLISLPAYMLAGLPPHLAIGTNKLSSSIGTAVATAQYIQKGFIVWRLAIPSIVISMLGANIGSHLTLLVSEIVFLIIMMVALPSIALYVFSHKSLIHDAEHPIDCRVWTVVLASAFLIGLYDGFYGPGTGTFLMLLLTGAAKLTIRQAAGITKAINLASNVMALTVFFLNASILLPLGLVAAVFSIAGNYLGARSFIKNGDAIARPAIIIVISIFIIKVAWDFFVK